MTCDPELGIPDAQPLDRRRQNLGSASEEVDAEPLVLRDREETEHEVDPGDPLGQRRAQEPRRPDDRLTVRVHERRGVEDSREAFVVPREDDLGRVERHVMAPLPREHSVATAQRRRLEVEPVDSMSEDVDRRRGKRLDHRRRDRELVSWCFALPPPPTASAASEECRRRRGCRGARSRSRSHSRTRSRADRPG